MTSTVSSAHPSNSVVPTTRSPTVPPEIREAIEAFFPLSIDYLSMQPLKGASVYKVTNCRVPPAQTYVLRSAFPHWTQERREREVVIARWVAEGQVGPEVLNVSDDSSFMLLEYFNGGTLNPNGPINLKEVCACLRNLHALGLPPSMREETGSTSFTRLRGQYAKIQSLYRLPVAIEQMYRRAREMEGALDEISSERVLCHLDLHCGNIMRHNGWIRLVDFGMTGPDHPYFDLANLAMYLGLSEEQEQVLLEEYLQEAPSHDQKRAYCYTRALVYLNKVTWKLIQAAKIGADSKMVEEVWKEPEGGRPITEYFHRQIYNPEDLPAIELVRYAHAAYDQFNAKYNAIPSWC